MPLNRSDLNNIAVHFNHVMKLNPPINFCDNINDVKLAKTIKLESKELQEHDIFPDHIIDFLNQLNIKHPLKKRSEQDPFCLDFIDKNATTPPGRKLINREESIVRTLIQTWQTLDQWADRSNNFYIEHGGKDNIDQALTHAKVALRFLGACGFMETRGSRKNSEYRISEFYIKKAVDET